MFFVLSKVLDFLLNPLMWIIILLLIGLFVKKITLLKKIYISIVILALFFTNPAIVDEFIRLWEEPLTVLDQNQKFEAGIVLGGGMVTYDNDYKRLIFRENTDRLLQAIQLYKKGHIKKIILSGGAGSIIFKNTLEASLLKVYLKNINIPDEDIIIDSTSNNTYENAVNCSKIIKQSCNEGKYLLITSSLHMKRASACFENQGICVTKYPTNKIVGPRRTDVGYYIIPNSEALIRWDKFIHEVLGFFIYTIMGYI